MSPFKLIPQVICLCLDKRKELWQDLKKQTESLGIEFIPFIAGNGSDSSLEYDLIDEENPDTSRWGYGSENHKKNHYRALACHKKIAEKCRLLGLERVMFMEDDAYWTSRAATILNTLESESQTLDFILSIPLIYAGWWKGQEDDEYNTQLENNYNNNGKIELREIIYGDNIGGAHGMILRKEMFPLIENLPMINPMDTQLCFMRKNIQSYKICPKIVHVKSCFSYCEGAVFNRKSI